MLWRSMFSFLCFLIAPLSWGQFNDENLLINLPKGYKIDFQTRQGNMIMSEMVPNAESVKNWTEMVTTQIFLGLKDTSPEQFQAFMQKRWADSCKKSEAASITKGVENGYPFALWVLSCPLNQASGKPEITWFKAIKGNDSFYLVQKAFKFEPTKEQITNWMLYMRAVTVCDTRLKDRSCPKLEKAR